jgi:hypothetical protein
MTTFTNKNINELYGDWLTTTNAGAGLSNSLQPVQDALGNSSPMKIALSSVDFSRTGKTFSFDGVNFTGDINILNNIGSSPYSKLIQGIILNNVTPITNTYIVEQTDCYISVVLTGPQTVTLPTPGFANRGQLFYIKDLTGFAGTDNITVNVTGGGLVDGALTFVISDNFGALSLISSGTRYSVISYYHP